MLKKMKIIYIVALLGITAVVAFLAVFFHHEDPFEKIARKGGTLADLHYELSDTVEPKKLDIAPIESVLTESLPPGQALAYFEFDTGGDQMSLQRMEVGLVIVVRYGNKELRQTIASCKDFGAGNAVFEGTERELDKIICGTSFYWLISENNKVLVRRVQQNKDTLDEGALIAQFDLPPGVVRAKKPK
ncbi:MAG: hypothetical protein HY080_13640 [Gammaproteobacteria bacterium]|nr:hypothetical protein [Gammaproteobacteria bacterium]